MEKLDSSVIYYSSVFFECNHAESFANKIHSDSLATTKYSGIKKVLELHYVFG